MSIRIKCTQCGGSGSTKLTELQEKIYKTLRDQPGRKSGLRTLSDSLKMEMDALHHILERMISIGVVKKTKSKNVRVQYQALLRQTVQALEPQPVVSSGSEAVSSPGV